MSQLKDYLRVTDGERPITNWQFNQGLLMVSARRGRWRGVQSNALAQLLNHSSLSSYLLLLYFSAVYFAAFILVYFILIYFGF